MGKRIKDDNYWMKKALALANRAEVIGEVPIGALIVKDGMVIGRGFNKRESANDPTAHAEMIAIRAAARKLDAWRLTGSTLYVTLEPCPMCMGAIILARIDRVVFGSLDPKGGAAGSLYDLAKDRLLNHHPLVTAGVMQKECSEILSAFFRNLRKKKKATATFEANGSS